MAKSETHVADPTGIDIMGFDGEIAAMIEQAVENVDGLARVGVHGDDVERAILVRGEAIKLGAGVAARNGTAAITIASICPGVSFSERECCLLIS
jgi:hypothetical protein